MKNNFMFKKSELYSFEEVATYLINQTSSGSFPPFEEFGLKELLLSLPIIVDGENVYGVSYVELSGHAYQFKSTALTCLNKIYLRYKDHYCVNVEDEVDKPKLFKDFFLKLLNLLDYTFPKYETLLGLYESKKDNLLDKLGRTRAGTRQLSQTGSNSDQHYGNGTDSQTIETLDLHNDTPKTSDIIATISSNQYVSDLKKGKTTSSGSSSDNYTNTGSSSSNGTDTFEEVEGFDTMTIMAKLDEIEKQFSQVWRKWLNEFDQLFIEEANY